MAASFIFLVMASALLPSRATHFNGDPLSLVNLSQEPVEGSRESVWSEEEFDENFPEHSDPARAESKKLEVELPEPVPTPQPPAQIEEEEKVIINDDAAKEFAAEVAVEKWVLEAQEENLTKLVQSQNDTLQEALLELERRRQVAEAANLNRSITLDRYLKAHAETEKANKSLEAMRAAIASARAQKEYWCNETAMLLIRVNETEADLTRATLVLRRIQAENHTGIKEAIAVNERLEDEALQDFEDANASLYAAEDDVNLWTGRLQKEVAKLNTMNDKVKDYKHGTVEAPPKLVDAVHEQATVVSKTVNTLDEAQGRVNNLTEFRDKCALKHIESEEALNKSRQRLAKYEIAEKVAVPTKYGSEVRYNETTALYDSARFKCMFYTREEAKLKSMLELPESILHVAVLEEVYAFQRWENSSAVSAAANNSVLEQESIVAELTLMLTLLENQLEDIRQQLETLGFRKRSEPVEPEPVKPAPEYVVVDSSGPGDAIPLLCLVLGTGLVVVLIGIFCAHTKV